MYPKIKDFGIMISLVIILLPILTYNSNLFQVTHSQQSNDNNVIINNVSSNNGDSVYPQIEANGNNVYLVWQDNLFGHNRLNYDILLKSSSDGGKTFGEVINLSNNSGFSDHPQMVVDGENIFVIWADNTSFNREIYFRSSSDGGKTFGEVINLSNNTAESYNQEIAVFNDNVYVVWLDSQKHQPGEEKIAFRSSSDGGETFGEVINLSNNSGISSFPKIASFDNNVYISWNVDRIDPSLNDNSTSVNDGIFFTKSNDSGKSFERITQLNSVEEPGEVQIMANKENVYIVWGSPNPYSYQGINSQIQSKEENTLNDGIFFTKSNDSGKSFINPAFINAEFNNPLNVEIMNKFGEIIVAIQATPINNIKEGNQDVFIMSSKDDGNTFSKAINISNNLGISECPSMTIDTTTNDTLVVWQDNTPGNNEAFFSILTSK